MPSHCVLIWWKGQMSSLGLLNNDSNSIDEGPTLMAQSPPKSPPPMTIIMGVRCQLNSIWVLGAHQHQVIADCLVSSGWQRQTDLPQMRDRGRGGRGSSMNGLGGKPSSLACSLGQVTLLLCALVSPAVE